MPAEHDHESSGHPADLRVSGRRLTQQRRAIWEALLADPGAHFSADDVVERVRVELPGVNSSTVYRTLALLVEEGLLRRTDLGADRAFYEPTHEHPHHHLVCERCGSVAHIHDDVLGDVADRIEQAAGFRLGSGELSLFGLCAACRAIEDEPV